LKKKTENTGSIHRAFQTGNKKKGDEGGGPSNRGCEEGGTSFARIRERKLEEGEERPAFYACRPNIRRRNADRKKKDEDQEGEKNHGTRMR